MKLLHGTYLNLKLEKFPAQVSEEKYLLWSWKTLEKFGKMWNVVILKLYCEVCLALSTK